MLCPISGKVPEHPVVTPQGHIYEARLLEEYRRTHGDLDPVSGEGYTPEQLVTIKCGATPELGIEAMPMGQLLQKVQSEFDVLLLQNFKLRTALDTMKGQLSQSLYQHDAACRVVARLTRERELWKTRMAAAPAATAEGTAALKLTAEKIEEITDNANDLQSVRKTAIVSQYEVEKLSTWQSSANAIPHEAARPGINDVTIKQQPGKGNVAITAGEDGHITMTELTNMTRVTKFQACDKAVTCVDVHPDADVIVAGCKDKSIRFFTGARSTTDDLSFSIHKISRSHSEAVSRIEIHPLGDFVMTGGMDNRIVFTDIDSGNAMCNALEDKHGLGALKFHPDGNLFFTGGQDGSLGVWDLREMAQKIRFNTNQDGAALTGVQVGPNGYYMSTCDTTGQLKVWDLRKFAPDATNNPTITRSIYDEVASAPHAFDVAMSNCNSMVAVCGETEDGRGLLRVGSVAKKAKEIVFGDVHSKQTAIVTRCMFVPNADQLVTVSKDNTIQLWAPEA